MRRLLIIAFLAVAGLLGGSAAASAAAPDVHIDNRGACHYVVVNGKDIPQNGLCYLGPPPIN